MKKIRAYMGCFRDGKCLFRLGNTVEITEDQIPFYNAFTGYLDRNLNRSNVFAEGDYIAWDYEEREQDVSK